MVSVADTPSRIQKLLARALDPSARDPEAETSAVMAIRHARRERLTLESFAREISPNLRLSAPAPAPTPPACDVQMTRGKHRGLTLRVAREYSDLYIATAAQTVIEWLTGDGGAL